MTWVSLSYLSNRIWFKIVCEICNCFAIKIGVPLNEGAVLWPLMFNSFDLFIYLGVVQLNQLLIITHTTETGVENIRNHIVNVLFQLGRPFPTRLPNLDLMYLASKRRVTSSTSGPATGRATTPSRQRSTSATISRTRGKRSRSASETDSNTSRTRSQTQEIEFIFDNDFGKFDDSYSLSGKYDTRHH